MNIIYICIYVKYQLRQTEGIPNMARPKPASLNGGLVRKGEAAPAKTSTSATALVDTLDIPHGTKDTIAITVRLDLKRYQQLMAYKAQAAGRVKNQDLFIRMFDAFMARELPHVDHLLPTH
jgi:hypothetical protein